MIAFVIGWKKRRPNSVSIGLSRHFFQDALFINKLKELKLCLIVVI